MVLAAWVLALSCDAANAEEPEVVRVLRLENEMLKSAMGKKADEVKALKEENAKLAEQVKQLQELCRKAGIGVAQAEVPKPAPPVAEPKGWDEQSKAAMIAAIRKYREREKEVEESDATTAQKSVAVEKAREEMTRELRRLPAVTATYAIKDVISLSVRDREGQKEELQLEVELASITPNEARTISVFQSKDTVLVSAKKGTGLQLKKGSIFTVLGSVTGARIDFSLIRGSSIGVDGKVMEVIHCFGR